MRGARGVLQTGGEQLRLGKNKRRKKKRVWLEEIGLLAEECCHVQRKEGCDVRTDDAVKGRKRKE